MSMQTSFKSKQERFDYWAARIREYQNSDLNITKWCLQNNIPRKSFYNHVYELKDNCYEECKDIFENKTKPVARKINNEHLKKHKVSTNNSKDDNLTIKMKNIVVTAPSNTDLATLTGIILAIKGTSN